MGGESGQIRVRHFIFHDFSEHGDSVHCVVKALGKREMSEKDTSEASKLLEDMGKWESFVRLLHDLKISESESSGGYFGGDRYEVHPYLNRLNGVLEVTFTLTEEEAVQRRGTTIAEMKKDEIENQVRNIDKWHNFAAFIKFAKEMVN